MFFSLDWKDADVLLRKVDCNRVNQEIKLREREIQTKTKKTETFHLYKYILT
jgi:hypothetical protein